MSNYTLHSIWWEPDFHLYLPSSASKYFKSPSFPKDLFLSQLLLGLEQVHFPSYNPQMLIGLTLSSPSPSTFSSSIPLEGCWKAWLRPFLAFFSSCLSLPIMEKLFSIRKGPSASGIHGDAKLLTLVELWEADHQHGKGLESIVGDFDLVGQAVLPSAVFFFFCSALQIP